MRAAALALALTALPAAAQDAELDALLALIPEVAQQLLADPDRDNRLGGALAACMIGVTDPQVAIAALEAAGWNPLEGIEGTLSFDLDGTFAETVTVALDPGFCMVETTSYGTADTVDVLRIVSEALEIPGFDLIGTGAGECPYAELGIGVAASISGPGNDPACTSDTAATVRFTIADI